MKTPSARGGLVRALAFVVPLLLLALLPVAAAEPLGPCDVQAGAAPASAACSVPPCEAGAATATPREVSATCALPDGSTCSATAPASSASCAGRAACDLGHLSLSGGGPLGRTDCAVSTPSGPAGEGISQRCVWTSDLGGSVLACSGLARVELALPCGDRPVCAPLVG